MVGNKIRSFISSLFDVLKREWLLLILVTLFIKIFSKNIFEWYHILIFVFILLIVRMKIFNMSIATYLVIFTIALNAKGLQQQNSLIKEQLKQFKHEERIAAIDNTVKEGKK